MLERLQEVDGAEDLRATLIGEVVDSLAVLDAVAAVYEGRVDRVAAGVERGCRGHDLEARAGREQAVGRAVQERRGRLARGVHARDESEVLLDQVRVVRRPRRHHEYG